MKRILFVCTGNTCRSPMAQAITRAEMPVRWRSRVGVSSAGTVASNGQPASPLAVEVLREIGVDLSEHRARRLTKDLVEESDLIVVMAPEHREAVTALSPAKEPDVMILGELDHGREDPGIDDPIGCNRSVYEKSRDEISMLVKRLIGYLAEKFELAQ